jgi:hypothetical protein
MLRGNAWLRGSATTFTELYCNIIACSLNPLREGKLLHNRLVGSSSPLSPTTQSHTNRDFLAMADLRKRGIVTKVRTLRTGETIGGVPFTRGSLAHLLRNRLYISEVAFKGEVLKTSEST